MYNKERIETTTQMLGDYVPNANELSDRELVEISAYCESLLILRKQVNLLVEKVSQFA